MKCLNPRWYGISRDLSARVRYKMAKVATKHWTRHTQKMQLNPNLQCYHTQASSIAKFSVFPFVTLFFFLSIALNVHSVYKQSDMRGAHKTSCTYTETENFPFPSARYPNCTLLCTQYCFCRFSCGVYFLFDMDLTLENGNLFLCILLCTPYTYRQKECVHSGC